MIRILLFLLLFGLVPVLATEYSEELKVRGEAGDADAQYSLGVCYRLGGGVRKDEKEAVKWYRKAADQGDDRAQFSLGACYAEGTGVVKNDSEAAKWYRMAAEQGHLGAQNQLGKCYQEGKGVSKNMTEAVKWFEKAAFGRSAPAQLKLGECYEFGNGVPKNLVEAYALYELGPGFKPQEEAKARVARKMSSEQIAAAKKRSQEIFEGFRAARANE